ncbi:hypothetical protein JYT84_00535, partial [bacterium AH-315-M10]|nr:hypothetical protein [bacterium AH-315-M10]
MLPLLALILLAATALGLASFRIHNNDIGYHIAYGRQMLETRSVPQVNRFSTANAGHRIHDDKWLFQLTVALADRVGGTLALQLLRLILVGALATLILLLIREELPLSGPLPWLGSLLAIWAMSERFLLRPELPSYLLLAAMLWQTERLRRDPGRGVWPLLLLQVIWVNVHGYFILGPAIAGALLTATLLRGGSKQEAWRWGRTTLLLILCCFVSPAGWRAAAYPLLTLIELYGRRDRARIHIQEFKPSLIPERFLTHTYLLYCFLLAAAPLAMLAARRRHQTLYRPIILLAFILMSLTIRRNIVLLGLVGSWMLVTSLGRLEGGSRPARGLGWAALLALGPLLLLQPLTDRLHLAEHRIRRHGMGLSRMAYPVAATEFLQREKLTGIYWNNFEIGSYLLWRHPGQLPMCDGNLNAVPLEFQQDYLALLSRWMNLEAYARKYEIAFWIIQHGPCDTLDLIGRLYRSPAWTLVYLDPLTVVFLPTRDPRSQRLAVRLTEPAAGQLPTPRPAPGFFRANLLSFSRARVPFEQAYLSKLYLTLGKPELAREAVSRALSACRWDARLFHQGALVALTAGQSEQAEAYLRAALTLKPGYASAHFNLGLLMARRDKPELALSHFQRAWDEDRLTARYAIR